MELGISESFMVSLPGRRTLLTQDRPQPVEQHIFPKAQSSSFWQVSAHTPGRGSITGQPFSPSLGVRTNSPCDIGWVPPRVWHSTIGQGEPRSEPHHDATYQLPHKRDSCNLNCSKLLWQDHIEPDLHQYHSPWKERQRWTMAGVTSLLEFRRFTFSNSVSERPPAPAGRKKMVMEISKKAVTFISC